MSDPGQAHEPCVEWDGWNKVTLACTADGCWWEWDAGSGMVTLAVLHEQFKNHTPTPPPYDT